MKQAILLLGLAGCIASPAVAQDITPTRPEVLNRVTACRAVAGPAERLACFDREVAALEAAAAAREIAVVDREQVRRTRRSLFGLRLPDLGIFDGDEDSEDDVAAVREITSTIRSSYIGSNGAMVFALEDGSVWVQTDGRRQQPRPGQSIRVRRGPLGSYIANIEDRVGFRVVRQR